MSKRVQLLDANQAEVRLTRIAYEIYENNIHENEIVLAGIMDRGLDIARQLKKKLEKICPVKIEIISVKIDKKNPVDCLIIEDFNPKQRNIIFEMIFIS